MNEMSKPNVPQQGSAEEIEYRIAALLDAMTLEEKIGQMNQAGTGGDTVPEDLKDAIRAGLVGSVINQSKAHLIHEMQRIACEESRLGIPLLIARDVIHGFETIAPIPLGQAASWNPDLARKAARSAAEEASRVGINWTFAPMMDISRDPRWGRIAESFGEDPYLTSVFSVAMVEGYQGASLADPGSIAACAKHFVGYGASEGGRDYNTTNISENELRNVYLPPFHAAVEAGIASVMSSFSDIDGLPATANDYLLKDILRSEWGFDGIAVSDWDSVLELKVHGIAEGDREAALLAAHAGIDIEMVGGSYAAELPGLIDTGDISMDEIDRMVSNILRVKLRLGLFETPYANPDALPPVGNPETLATLHQLAAESIVLLKNDGPHLPLQPETLTSVAVIGPLADSPKEQLGTWVFDGNPASSVTPLLALRDAVGGKVDVHYAKGVATTIDPDTGGIDEAVVAARASDVALLFIGEDAILSGEAHCRADIGLPGAQSELVSAIKAAGKPVVGVIMAGRPLTLESILSELDAVLYAWHPGTMAGPAICDILTGKASPSGRLPVTFPRAVGQVPIYYNHKNTGRPPTPDTIVRLDEIEVGAPQTSLGMTAFYLDAGDRPLFPFGFGLSYTDFAYDNLRLSHTKIRPGETLEVNVDIKNTGSVTAAETVQLYIRDPAASLTRPVRELKAFQKITLNPGEAQTVTFALTEAALAFYGRDRTFKAEPGRFQLWLGPNAAEGLEAEFRLEV